MKTCKATGQTFPLSEYYTRTITRKDGTTYVRTDPVCKEYRRMKMKKYYQYKKAMKAYSEIVEQIPEPNFWDKEKFENKTILAIDKVVRDELFAKIKDIGIKSKKTFLQKVKDLFFKRF